MNKPESNPVKTVLTISLGFIVIYLITKWKYALSISLLIGIMGIFSDYLSKKIDFLWMKLASLLSLIIPNILLGTIFYLFLFPIAILSKIFGKKDPLLLKNKPETFFIHTGKTFENLY